jgi:alkylation response protein AidB-like acyl-CoA dehydrogenase
MSDFAELHDELRAVARDLLGRTGRPGWRQLAEAGWLGLEVPDDLDGAGATFAEAAVVLEERGRAATTGPWLGTAVLGVGLLELLASDPGRDALLRLVATGERVLAVAAVDGDDARPFADPGNAADDRWAWVPFRLARSSSGDGGWRLDGRAAFVPDAPDADRVLALALDPEGEPVVVALHSDAAADVAGLDVVDQPVLDATRRFGTVVADGVEVADGAVWRFAADPHAGMVRLLDRGALAVAVDSLGLSEAMLAATVAYARDRQQFGRPIGSFQAVKHACADMLVHVTLARELVTAAVRALADADRAGADADAAVAVSRAKSYAGGAAVDVVGKALQLHGGIGYTWESGVHVHLKRAALNRSLMGSPTAHRRRIAGRLAPLAGS